MAFQITARNTATAASSGTSTATSTLTVTSTIVGDVGVVAVFYTLANIGGTSVGHTLGAPPAGWTLAKDEFSSSGAQGWGVALYYNPSLAAGVTSLAFSVTATGTGGTLSATAHTAYAAVIGGTSRTLSEGAAGAATASSSTTLPSVTTAAAATSPDLIVWGGFGDSATGTPTGFTSVVVITSLARMAFKIAAQGTTTTASGATCTAGSVAAVAVVGLTTRASNGFFSLAQGGG